MTHMTRRAATALLALLVSLAAGCGGGAKKAPGPAELEESTHDFAVKMFDGGEGTYDYLSEDCRDEISRAKWGTSIALAIGLFKAFVGEADGEDLVGDVETRKVTAESGESRFDLEAPEDLDDGATLTQGDDWIKWIVEDGEWRLTDCEDVLSGETGDTGDTGGGFDEDDPSSLDFEGAPVDVEIQPADMFETPTSGAATVTLLSVEEIPSPMTSEGYGEIAAEGRFVAVQYEVENGTDKPLHHFFDVVTDLDATDGATWFEISDGAASDALSNDREGEDSTADVEAGATATAWLVFDVPENAEIVGLGYRPGFFEATPLSLPGG